MGEFSNQCRFFMVVKESGNARLNTGDTVDGTVLKDDAGNAWVKAVVSSCANIPKGKAANTIMQIKYLICR
ncbi:MAG: hypothetical protein BGO32_03715 [Bacteroidetes bacterium 37-13]|nr:MAG: hypothetical protein BGO32_03715 [Bacteroidetes bacterium 37-13]